MAFINDNYQKLPGNYLFSEIAKRVSAFQSKNPEAKVIRLGIGDVTQPLPKVCIDAMKRARLFAAMVRNKVMISFVKRLPITITSVAASTLRRTKYLLAMAQNVTVEISKKYLDSIIKSQLPTQSILYISIQMLWPVEPESLKLMGILKV